MASGEQTPLLRSDSVSVRQPHKVASRLVTVEPIMLIFSFYRICSTTMIQQYMYDRIGRELNFTENATINVCNNASQDEAYYDLQQKVQAEASLWLMYQNICVLLIGFVSTIFLGGYSDKAGRKIAIISPIVGGMIRMYLVMVVTIYDLPLFLLLVASIIDGAFGGMTVFYMAIFSYISDVTATRQRSVRIIVLEVCIGLGSAVSFFVTGYMTQYLKYVGTTLILHLLLFICLLLASFSVPETVTKAHGLKFFNLEHFKESFRVYLKDDGKGRRSVLLMSMLILFLVCPVHLGGSDIRILYTYNSPLCWNTLHYGYFMALFSLLSSVASILLAKFFQPKVGDLALVLIGCLSEMAFNVYMSFASTSLMMYIVPLLGMFSSLPIGMLRAFNSKIVTPHELGAMFSWVAWIEMLGSILGSVIFTNIYRATLTWYKGLVFITLGAGSFLTAIVTVVLMVKIRKSAFLITHPRSSTND